LLSDTENEEVTTMANTHSEIKDEIIAIEKIVVSSFHLHSVANMKKSKLN
jgi:uncharacterized protein YdcH (DUF465 family)